MEIRILALLSVLFLSACSETASDNLHISDGSEKFTGTIAEISGNRAIVEVDVRKGKLLSGGKVAVDLAKSSEQKFREGDRVEVEFDGVVRESNPAQVKTIAVEPAE